MSEYIYCSNGEPLANERGEIFLARAGEVVRCGDCVKFGEYGKTVKAYWCGYWTCYKAKPDGFCAWGIR